MNVSIVRPSGRHRYPGFVRRNWTDLMRGLGLIAAGAAGGLILGAFVGVTS